MKFDRNSKGGRRFLKMALVFVLLLDVYGIFLHPRKVSLGLVPDRKQFNLYHPAAGTPVLAPEKLDMQLLQIHVQEYFYEKKIKTFSEISEAHLDEIKSMGFNAVWMMGIWIKSPYSRALNLSYEKNETPGRMASLFSIPDYQVDPNLGGEKDFKNFVGRAAAKGIRVVVDFVPTHLAVDSPLIDIHPEWFQKRIPPRILGWFLSKDKYFLKTFPDGRKVFFAHANNNEFFMKDTVMLDPFNPGTWQFLERTLDEIAALTHDGGVRIDMITELYPATVRKKVHRGMSVKAVERKLDEVSLEAFGEKPQISGAVLEVIIKRIKAKHPHFIFIGETYQGQEAFWRAVGIDLTYAKCVYDWLVMSWGGDVKAFRDFLFQKKKYKHVPRDFLTGSVYFLENHDETVRALSKTVFFSRKPIGLEEGIKKSKLIMTAIATIPGTPFVYWGQFQGRWGSVPSATWFSREKPRDDDAMIHFYRNLLQKTKAPLFRRGTMQEVPVLNQPQEGLVIAFARIYQDQVGVVALNFSPQAVMARLDTRDLGLKAQENQVFLEAWGSKVLTERREAVSVPTLTKHEIVK